MQDQRLAFEWIRMNIAAFGGSPNDVTISGQSAGGVSVAVHMATPKSSGLFQKVSAFYIQEPYGINSLGYY